MENLEIHGDFDWSDDLLEIGNLLYDQIRGAAAYTFTFSKAWLQSHRNISLSGDLQNFVGPQHKSRNIFAFLSDALPDRWGRKLIDKRERILAEKEKRPVKVLNDFDYMISLDDYSRMGALRFKKAK